MLAEEEGFDLSQYDELQSLARACSLRETNVEL